MKDNKRNFIPMMTVCCILIVVIVMFACGVFVLKEESAPANVREREERELQRAAANNFFEETFYIKDPRTTGICLLVSNLSASSELFAPAPNPFVVLGCVSCEQVHPEMIRELPALKLKTTKKERERK